MGEKKRTLRGFLCAALGGVCWGASGTVGQYLFTCQGVDSGWLTVVRMFLAGVVLLGGALVRHRPQLRAIWSDRRDALRLVLFSVGGLMTCQYTYLAAIRYSNSATATVLQYEMLTGRLPFEGDSAVSVAIQHLSSVPLSPREIDPDVPEALEKICMKAMASDIDRRYPTADAMLADLEEFRKNPDVDLDFSIEDLRRPDTDEPTQYIPAVQAVTPKREEPQEDEPVDEKKTQKMLLLAGGIALAAVIVFALWNVIMGSFQKEPVQTEFTVPNLLGMTIEEAEADERVKGIFTITEMGSRASSEYAEGQIVEQTPAADNVVRSNREIQVFVSTGEKTEPMPSVTGLEWRSAKIILDDLGLDLQYNWKDEYSDSITSGCVIRTEPAKGEMLRQGDVLLLYRSKGPEPKPVTVISFLTYEQTTAVEEAETLGLKVTVKHVYSDALAGTVVEQSIAQDTVVTTGAEIVLTVSDGPDPSVSGTEGIPPEAA